MSWISKNKYLSVAEQQNNATMFYQYFAARGWTLNAIAGMLGNIQHESTINPGIWEGLNSDMSVTNKGYGLVQWTPWTKYSEWCGSNWQNNGDMECERIIWERDNGAQFYPTDAYPMSFTSFAVSTQSARTLAVVFLHNYERPAKLTPEKEKEREIQRGDAAETWFAYLGGQPVPDPTPTTQQNLMYRRKKRGIHRTVYVSRH